MKKINLLFFPLILALFAVHFHDQRSFKREFINYDDVEFIQPLKEISSAREYFDKRVFAKDAYGFPLRDLTLIADFRLSEFLGWKTFWLSNFVVYTLVLLVQLFFFRELFPGKP